MGQQADSDAEQEEDEEDAKAEPDDVESAAGVNTSSVDSASSSYSRFKEAREAALISGSRTGDIVVPEARRQPTTVLPDAMAGTETPLPPCSQEDTLEMDDVDGAWLRIKEEPAQRAKLYHALKW